MPKSILVDFVADPVCPWCYVGLHSLRAARNQSADARYEIRFRPYQLNPDTPMEGVDRREYYEHKFPDAGFRESMRERLHDAASAAGASFDPMTPTRLPNTLAAHAAIQFAGAAGGQDAFALALYQAFWVEGLDIGETEVLAGVGAQTGLDAQSLTAAVTAMDTLQAVRAEADAFRAAGVTGVPTFIVNERTGFSGALPPGDLAEALRQAAARN